MDKGDDSAELVTTPVACVADSLISKRSESALLLCFTIGELINLSSPELLGIFWETEETGGNFAERGTNGSEKYVQAQENEVPGN